MPQSKINTKIILSEEQIEVLNGAMLGDGSLYIHSNGGKNAQLIYTSKSRQHVEFVMNYFKEYWSGENLKYSTFFDNRTNKEYSRYTIKTYTNQTFTDYYQKWYQTNNKKSHIPLDLKLTPLTCLIWYIGDGGLIQGNSHSQYIKLSTQCFSKEDQENILLPQLSTFNATLMKADKKQDNKQQYYIYIPHVNEEDFFNFIGKCPFSDYQYKWNILSYKNKKPKNHKIHEQEFCEMYKSGMTYYAIAKQFNIEPNAVKYYLKKNNLY